MTLSIAWWGVLGMIAVLAIAIAGALQIERCPRCKSRAEETSRKDPLPWGGRKLPRIVTISYRCSSCQHEFTSKHLG